MSEPKKWWWIAINGASCVCAPFPMVIPMTRPRAEQLVGFPTMAEAASAQHLLLMAPMEVIEQYVTGLAPRFASGELHSIRPENPEPPTKGQTIWTEGGKDDAGGFVAEFEGMDLPSDEGDE